MKYALIGCMMFLTACSAPPQIDHIAHHGGLGDRREQPSVNSAAVYDVDDTKVVAFTDSATGCEWLLVTGPYRGMLQPRYDASHQQRCNVANP